MRRPSRSGLQMTAGLRGRILGRVREDEAMGRLVVRWFISALALLAAAWLVPGIRVDGNAWVAYAGMAVILGLVNAVIRPLLKLLTCPLILLTLGLFVLVVNAVSLLIAAKIAAAMGSGFHVDGFLPAFLGALIVSVVTVILSAVTGEKD
jgi:putative membrane protein